MGFKRDILLAAACVSLLSLGIPAFGHPLPRDLEQAHRAHRVHRTIRHGERLAQVARRHAAPAHENAPRQRSYLQRIVDASTSAFNGSALVAEARKYMGTNPTDRKRLWCATFMNFILAKLGYTGTHSDAAKSFVDYGRRINRPEIGAIAVLTRGRRGGHVGVVSGIDAHGNPIIISGNHNRRVGIGIYPRSRVIAYVLPTRRQVLPVRHTDHGPAIDSPISELLATISDEADRAEARASVREAVRSQRAVRTQRSVQPYRLVQQMPDQVERRDLPLDPRLAEFFGIGTQAKPTRERDEARR